MFQKVLVVSSIAFAVAATTGVLDFPPESASSTVLKVWREPQGWMTPQAGTYRASDAGTIAFDNGISTRTAGANPASGQSRPLLVALAHRDIR